MNSKVSYSVRNFGSLIEGKVDLRPLTVFVGENHSGKTYFSTLIYALQGVYATLQERASLEERYARSRWALKQLLDGGSLPQSTPIDEADVRRIATEEITNGLNVPSVSSLRRVDAAQSEAMTLSLKVRTGDSEGGFEYTAADDSESWKLTPVAYEVGRRHYLPAIRAGLLQQHSLIASLLVGRATQGNDELSPLFVAGQAEFLKHIMFFHPEKGMQDVVLNALADALEADVLGGQILARLSPTGYPRFSFRQRGMKAEMELNHASAMVSELAPLVLLLRRGIVPGDLLVIEEPETHLHPSAQSKIALTFARLVRAGVQVVITTHSDWLLKAIANLMRLGELKQKGERSEPGDSQQWLLPEEVGVWWFQKGVVKPIPFERSYGVEPADYEDVADELYDRSVNLQDGLDKTDFPSE